MDQTIAAPRPPATFNGPLEAGVRAVTVLGAAYPRPFDLQRLVAFDYLLVHTADIGGPESLHPLAPLQPAEFLVRRKLVEGAVLLMMTRDLIRREAHTNGLQYSAGDNATPFLEALQTHYLVAMKERAAWLVNALGDHSETQFRTVMRRFFGRWVEEFQAAEQSFGADP
jgi:hypothetical protein